MSNYEILDHIADAYNPSLFLVYVIMSVVYWRGGDRLAGLKGFVGLLIAYAIMFIDNSVALWGAADLDYSTHSAVALALIIFHVHKKKISSMPAALFLASLVGYYVLEVYQEYHTVADIISTALVVGVFAGMAYWLIGRCRVVEKSSELLN